MTVVQLEHPIRDFATWKAAFDRDPDPSRGVWSAALPDLPANDRVRITLPWIFEFDSPAGRLRPSSVPSRSSGARRRPRHLGGTPRARIVDVVESKAY